MNTQAAWASPLRKRIAWLALATLAVYAVAHAPEVLHVTDPIDVFFRWSEADDIVAALLFFAASSLLLLVAQQHRERQSLLQKLELEKMRDVSALRTQFFNALAHELGNPVTPLRIQAKRLQSARPDLAPPLQNAVDIVDRNVTRLAALLADVLDVARLDSGKLRLQVVPTNLVAVVKDILTSYEGMAREAGLTLEFQGEAAIEADADKNRIGQVMANLLSNAIKFTPKDGHVAVHVERQGDQAVVTVQDTGRGLAPADAAKLFQPFTRLGEEPQGKLTGTGLGLFICKGLVEQHGGRIWCTSPGANQGTTFSFTLPLHGTSGLASSP